MNAKRKKKKEKNSKSPSGTSFNSIQALVFAGTIEHDRTKNNWKGLIKRKTVKLQQKPALLNSIVLNSVNSIPPNLV